MKIEVPVEDRHRIDEAVTNAVRGMVDVDLPEVSMVMLDPHAYAPGRAFVGAT